MSFSEYFAGKDGLTLFLRVFADFPAKVQVVYGFAQTEDNCDSVLVVLAEYWRRGRASKILLCDGRTDHGYVGYKPQVAKLVRKYSVREYYVEPMYMDYNTPLNTLSEAEHLVAYAKRDVLGIMAVCAAPFHQLRAFITTISVAIRDYPELNIFSLPGGYVSNLGLRYWVTECKHSQGVVKGTPESIFAGELERIDRYYKKGDICSPAEILEYMHGRDERLTKKTK